MPDQAPLSPFEVDSLLTALAEERQALSAESEPDPRSVRPYDFRRPDKLSKDQIRTLQILHERFARLLSSSMTAYLRVPGRVQLTVAEQTNVDEYLARISTPALLCLVKLEPLGGYLVLELGMQVAFTILDRLLGGPGRIPDRARQVTDIEISLLRSVVGLFLATLKDAWSNLARLESEIEEITLNPQLLERALPNDSAVRLSFLVQVQETEGMMHLVIPYETVTPVLDKLSAQYFVARGAGPTAADQARLQVEHISVPVRVELGQAVVTLRELSDLQPGDVIPLNSFVHDDLDVYVNRQRKFRARPGLLGNRVAVQVTEVHDDLVSFEIFEGSSSHAG